MTIRRQLMKLLLQEDINFLLTNRIPRRAATRFMGWFSKIENPAVRAVSIASWRFFADVDLSDAATASFRSLHDAFIRALKPGARAADTDPDIIVRPCDAIIGAHRRIDDDRLYQIKGFPYRLGDLIGEGSAVEAVRNGCFVTLRLTAGMYHRFHALHDLRVEAVTYKSGDCWNVNPIALKRVERLFCRNERAVIEARLAGSGLSILLVPVAAILVAGIRLTFLDTPALLREGGERRIDCSATLAKGEEMGWFEHGSTIIVFVPPGVHLHPDVAEGRTIRCGQPLFLMSQT